MGYGGDGHTSMEFAMATYESVCSRLHPSVSNCNLLTASQAAFFSKWAADWVSVQGYDGTNNLPNTVSSVHV